jgi:hypothetical protein
MRGGGRIDKRVGKIHANARGEGADGTKQHVARLVAADAIAERTALKQIQKAPRLRDGTLAGRRALRESDRLDPRAARRQKALSLSHETKTVEKQTAGWLHSTQKYRW